jgi:hypothetical protein
LTLNRDEIRHRQSIDRPRTVGHRETALACRFLMQAVSAGQGSKLILE